MSEIAKPISMPALMDEFSRLHQMIGFGRSTIGPASDFDDRAFSEYMWTLHERAEAFATHLEEFRAQGAKP